MNNTENLLRRTTYLVVIIFFFGYLMKQGAPIVQPFIFAILLALFLVSIDRRILKVVKIHWLSIFLTYLTVFIPFGIIIGLFSMQMDNIIRSLPAIGNDLKKGIAETILFIESKIPGVKVNIEEMAMNNATSILDMPLTFLTTGIATSTSFIIGFVMCLLYCFFLLLYRKSFKNFLIHLFAIEEQDEIENTLEEIKETVESYFGGVGIVMVILTILNTLGLWAIGIKFPFFWAALGGLLGIIPYVGTTIGGILPFLFAMATTDSLWQPLAVALYYFLIQQIEGNIITPKIVGDQVDINPLFALMSIIFFAFFWGIGGVILALPIVSIIRILLEQSPKTEAFALLMSSEIDKSGKFKKIAIRRNKIQKNALNKEKKKNQKLKVK